MKLVFMGTPDFAVPSLLALKNDGHSIEAVFTQPDKPKGRGYTLTPPPVKECAEKLGIPVFQPTALKDGEAERIIKGICPDAVIVVAYGKILPKAILDIPEYGCINVHASLLPKYRGAAPIQWSVINGDTETGVTTMFMAEGLDTGDMLLKSAIKIDDCITAGELHDKLAVMGGELIVETLKLLQNGTIMPEKQNDLHSCYAPMLSKDLSAIDFNLSNVKVHNKVRGLSPWPVATATLSGRVLKIHKTAISDVNGEAGTVICENPFTVACKEGSVIILELQPEGKRKMTAMEYLRGNPILPGTKLM